MTVHVLSWFCQAGILLLLLVLAAIDLHARRLPHPLTAALAVLALLRAVLDGGNPWAALGAGLVVGLPFWLLRRIGRHRATRGRPAAGVGGGDVRFAFATGCLLGAGPGLLAAAAATTALFLAGLAARLTGRRTAALPLGPFLALPVILLVLLQTI
jgi:prepilin signal peptidase PulO-like enzyme (type II secretory pathway)